jgi:O-antigen ligase
MLRAAQWLALASAVCAIFSIAACQILLALALAALLLSGAPLRLPPVWLPVALFMAGSILSMALSDDPADGLSQIRKFYVWLILLVVFSTLRGTVWARRLFLAWGGAAAVTSLRALVQFYRKAEEARLLGVGFYDYYVGERITGFMSHWMTFSGQMMYAIIVLAAFVLFAPGGRKRLALWAGCMALAGVALVLAMTRGVAFVATPAALLYLAWHWKRKALLAVPVLAAVAFFASPDWVKLRFTSIFQPGRVDSNEFRKVAWRGGMRIVEQHPLLGLGPERVKARFMEFVPADVPRPLPAGWYGHLHNIYLHYAAERGIPTMLALMWFLFQALWTFSREARKLPGGRSDEKFILHAAAAAVVATLAEGFFELNLGDSEVLTMFLAIVALGYVAVERAREARGVAAVAA